MYFILRNLHGYNTINFDVLEQINIFRSIENQINDKHKLPPPLPPNPPRPPPSPPLPRPPPPLGENPVIEYAFVKKYYILLTMV